MGFDLKELKKKQKGQESRTISCKTLFVGSDLATAVSYLLNCHHCPQERSLLLSKEVIREESLLFPGPSLLRTSEDRESFGQLLKGVSQSDFFFELFKEKFENGHLEHLDLESGGEHKICARESWKRLFQNDLGAEKGAVLFYKDQKLRALGGRAKPRALRDDEKIYTHGSQVAPGSLVLRLIMYLVLKELEKPHHSSHYWVRPLEQVIFDSSSELPHGSFGLKLSSGELLCCSKLVFGEGIYSFVELAQGQKMPSQEFAHRCLSKRPRKVLCLHFLCDQAIWAERKTFLIPQSQTHEWGHFIVYCEEPRKEGAQEVYGLFFVDEHQDSGKEMTRKIKNFKAVLGRVFPLFAEKNYKQSVAVSQTLPHYSKEQASELEGMYSNLRLTGPHDLFKTLF
jgi:hypothetical protein